MKKILHCASMLTPPSGIISQMHWEKKAAHEIQTCEWDVKIFCPIDQDVKEKRYCEEIFEFSTFSYNKKSNKFEKFLNWFYLKKEYYLWLKKKETEYDIIILRNSVHDIFQYYFIKNSKNKIFIVTHTKESDELAMNGLIGKFRSIIDNLIAKKTLVKVTGLIGVTNELIKYQQSKITKKINTYLYPNGIICDENKPLYDERVDDEVNILFVASYFYEWHGLDLLIDNVSKNENLNYKIHIIGEISEYDKESIKNISRVVYHGSQNSDYIEDVAKKCDVGLSSFALFRKGMDEACTLKVREYLNLGLPVYAGHNEVFPNSFKFYKKGNTTIKEIYAYGISMKNYSKDTIFLSSIQYINKIQLLKLLAGEILNK